MKRRGGFWNSYAAMIPLRILAAVLPRRICLFLAIHPWARFLIDFMYLSRWEKRWVTIDGIIPSAPFIILGKHEGHWEMGAAALAQKVPLTVVVEHHPDPKLMTFREKVRNRFGIETIVDRGSVAPKILSALRRGRAVALLVDRDPKALRGATVLARRVECPILQGTVPMEPRGQYRLVVSTAPPQLFECGLKETLIW
ncbi:MAG: hypothetical protein QF645_07360 [Planctomycetota bacterium]|nr:hypothetical protein [Planctomycetota bacterium]